MTSSHPALHTSTHSYHNGSIHVRTCSLADNSWTSADLVKPSRRHVNRDEEAACVECEHVGHRTRPPRRRNQVNAGEGACRQAQVHSQQGRICSDSALQLQGILCAQHPPLTHVELTVTQYSHSYADASAHDPNDAHTAHAVAQVDTRRYALTVCSDTLLPSLALTHGVDVSAPTSRLSSW